MPVQVLNSTLPGGLSVVCGECGVGCGDISDVEYIESKAWWDGFVCDSCDPNGHKRQSLKKLQEILTKKLTKGSEKIVKPRCAHCGNEAELTTGRTVYPHLPELATNVLWICEPCQAWCGVHKNSRRYASLGTPANADLRKLRRGVHSLFDSLWQKKIVRDQCTKSHARKSGYRWLADKLSIPLERCHVGEMNVDQCVEAIKACTPPY